MLCRTLAVLTFLSVAYPIEAAAAQNWFWFDKCFWAHMHAGHAWHAEQRPQLKYFRLATLGFMLRHERESCKGLALLTCAQAIAWSGR